MLNLIAGAEWWEALEPIAASAAVVVALVLAYGEARRHRLTRQELDRVNRDAARKRRQDQANLVTTWVESAFVPIDGGSSYAQNVHLSVANEGTEPVDSGATSST